MKVKQFRVIMLRLKKKIKQSTVTMLRSNQKLKKCNKTNKKLNWDQKRQSPMKIRSLPKQKPSSKQKLKRKKIKPIKLAIFYHTEKIFRQFTISLTRRKNKMMVQVSYKLSLPNQKISNCHQSNRFSRNLKTKQLYLQLKKQKLHKILLRQF